MNEPLRDKVFPTENPIGAYVELSEGLGNLNLKAYMAAVAGPKRLAHGNRSARKVSDEKSRLLSKNSPASGQVFFVAVSLPANDPGPRSTLFGSDESLGTNEGIPGTLTNAMTVAGNYHSFVLLPGDQLYAQAAPGGGTYNVVVSEVAF